jgi:hypothetical protein
MGELLNSIAAFQDDIQAVIMRNRFSSGMRRRKRGELGELEGWGPPYYGDPVGEEAMFDEVADHTTKQINSIASMVRTINKICKDLLSQSQIDVRRRALHTIPDCLACGDPCVARVIAGFDDKCYKAWQRQGRPDRMKFIREVQAKRSVASTETDASDAAES